jgi:plasmid stabilization system protein ParE
MLEIRFHPESERELREAFVWYEHQRPGLGAEFILSIDEAIERLRRSPETYPKVHKTIRRIVVRRFPFIILYENLKSEIRVIAVFHSRRDPEQWQTRK